MPLSLRWKQSPLELSKAGARHSILVNTVRGGFIDTPMHQKLGRSDNAKRIKMIPLKKAGKPQDVAGMVLFLASEAGNFITGEDLHRSWR